MSDDRLRRKPWIHTWTDDDGIRRQAVIHYTRDDRSVVFDPRYPGDPEPWFDGDTVNWRCGDEDLVTLGDPNDPHFGLVDPDWELEEDDETDPVIQDIPSAAATSAAEHQEPEQTKEYSTMAIAQIPEVVNHQALLAGLAAIRMEVEARQEDVTNLAAWSSEMADRWRHIGEELAGLELDTNTIAHTAMLADTITGQARSAVAYRGLTDQSVNQAEVASRTARRHHGRIEEAVNDAPVRMAKNTFYNAE
ncbi:MULTISPECIES: hypothetical protein [Streptomyces]|uniref:Uncharacterized protein n=3 Tax=Streptomyces rimosus TaxID=1927 RepID=L8F054_STRR1|nr:MULTISPECIES: hypothetical protein [Streptomyces]KOG73107.1 hypothetical protein ADK78_17795 [Kitasatospora aureofaciens]MYT42032.1 hypothetical protein [Streptomyces sp. SID5471]KEF04880.1 hypothetical protein DF17_21815 [Streptomyces rimosus]KEF16695.1 hypothetical protein DF18_33795 [Streptomyces rimosus]KOT38654.1 hypothetical protein ADK42_17075 [Streptomyces rimosus subsp. rimosus]